MSTNGANGARRPAAREPNLAREYRERVLPALVKEFDYANVMQAPRVAKVVVNIGVDVDVSRSIT